MTQISEMLELITGFCGFRGSRGNGVSSRKPDPPKHAQESSDDVDFQQTPSNQTSHHIIMKTLCRGQVEHTLSTFKTMKACQSNPNIGKLYCFVIPNNFFGYRSKAFRCQQLALYTHTGNLHQVNMVWRYLSKVSLHYLHMAFYFMIAWCNDHAATTCRHV